MLLVTLSHDLAYVDEMDEVFEDAFSDILVIKNTNLKPRHLVIWDPSKVIEGGVEEEAHTFKTQKHYETTRSATSREMTKALSNLGATIMWPIDGSLVAKVKLAFLFFRIAFLKLCASKGFMFGNKENFI